MIPWFEYHSIYLGFLKLNVWGIFVSLGFVIGMVVAYFELKKRKLDANRIYDLAFWIILSALIGGRIFFVVEHLNFYSAAPLEILKLWHGGMSVYGGFFGAIFAAVIYLKKYKLDFWQYADAVAFGLPLGLFIGRLGCFSIHDHPGIKTEFFLGVNFPDGVRHDLGLYDALLGLAIFLIFLFLRRKERFTGFYVSTFAIFYGAVRFFLDFFRAEDLVGSDPRYLGLTLAQYLSIILSAGGIWLFYKLKRRNKVDSKSAI
ncbi:MAG: prolipoprotein diacylglyceryl transferase [Patescibacteria group bacterium]